jgi:hypothetical protein
VPLLMTEGRDLGPGTQTRIEEARWLARRAIVGVCVALLLGVAGIVGGWAWYRELRQQIVAVSKSVSDVGQLTESEKDAIAGLSDRIGRVSEELSDVDLTPVVQKAAESVYLVLLKTPDGVVYGLGTSWVVNQELGLLATNAHVAELHLHGKLLDQDLPDNCVLIVRSPGEKPRDFEVTGVTLHPGYKEFTELWSGYDPSRPMGAHRLEQISSAGNACDVALLTVKVNQVDRLAPRLELAPVDALKALKSGMHIGLVGYPLESLSIVNLDQPTLQLHFGNISAITDFFGSPDRDCERLLIQHSAPTAGGASGSPLLNARGEVIAIHSAGSTIAAVDGARIGSPAEIHYAQRSDLITELLNHVDLKRQPIRYAEWQKRIAQFFEPGRQAKAGWLVDDVKKELETALIAKGEYDVVTKSLPSQTVTLAPGETDYLPAVWHSTVQFSEAGYYLIAALGRTETALNLTANIEGKVIRGTNPASTDWVQTVQFQISKPTELKLTVRAKDARDSIQIDTYYFARRRKSVDALHEMAAAHWSESLNDGFGDNVRFSKLGEVTGELTQVLSVDGQEGCAARFLFKPEQPGRYLVSAVSFDEQPLRLHFNAPVPSHFDSGAEATRLAVAMQQSKPEPISGLVISRQSGAKYSLRLYRAELP